MAPDHYQLLGVARAALREEITQAWRRRARAEHPDRRPPEAGDAAAGRFRALAEAYHVLSDPDRRAAYDSTLSPAAARTRAGYPVRPDPGLLAEPPLRAGPVRIDGLAAGGEAAGRTGGLGGRRGAGVPGPGFPGWGFPGRGAGPAVVSPGWADRDRGLFSISVAAELAGLHPQTLRIYEREGLLDPARSAGGTRRYSARDMDRLQEICALTADGLNLAGIRRVLQLQEETRHLQAKLDRLRTQAGE